MDTDHNQSKLVNSKEFPTLEELPGVIVGDDEMKAPPVWYKITNMATGTVVDVDGLSKLKIHAWSDVDVRTQQWKLEQLTPKYYYAIKNRASDAYLCVEDPLTFNGARLVVSDSERGEWQFQLDEVNKAFFRIWAAGTTFAIDIEDGLMADGARIHLWEHRRKSESQMWRLVRADEL